MRSLNNRFFYLVSSGEYEDYRVEYVMLSEWKLSWDELNGILNEFKRMCEREGYVQKVYDEKENHLRVYVDDGKVEEMFFKVFKKYGLMFRRVEDVEVNIPVQPPLHPDYYHLEVR